MKQLMGDLLRPKLTPHEPPFTSTGWTFSVTFTSRRVKFKFTDASSSVSPAELSTSKMSDLWSQTPSSKPYGALSMFVVPPRKSGKSRKSFFFTGGEKEIRGAIQDLHHDIIERSLHEKDVEWPWYCLPLSKWHFHPPTASHMYGVWERLIRSVRSTMKAILGYPHAFVTMETLRTPSLC